MNNIQKARQAVGLTQQEAADRAGIGRTTYARYECGMREPGVETYVTLARIFGTTVDYLIGAPADDEDEERRLKFALFGSADVTDAQWQEVQRYARWIHERDHQA